MRKASVVRALVNHNPAADVAHFVNIRRHSYAICEIVFFFFLASFFLKSSLSLSLSLFQWRLITLSVKWIRFFILRTSSTSSAEIGKRDGRSFTRVDTFPRLPLLFFLPSSRASIPRMRNYDLIKQEIFRTNDLRLVT